MRAARITATIISILLGLWFLLAGAQKFLSQDAFESMFTDFGLPLWLVPVIGVLEIAGAVLVLIPTTAPFGAATITCVMIGAILSHVTSGVGSPVGALVALAMSVAVIALRWRTRWASRTGAS